MASILQVEQIKGPTSGASANKITIPSGQTLDVSDTTLTGITQGITDFDMWRKTSAQTVSSATLTTVTGWERTDDTGFEKKGTGMTTSSSVFSFPNTGKYFINLNGMFDSAGTQSDYNGIYIQVTYDGGSNWTSEAFNTDMVDNRTNARGAASTQYILDVTNTTNVKCRVACYSHTGVKVYGDTNSNSTTITFIRLGDT